MIAEPKAAPTPPQAVEAERSLLCAAILDSEVLARISEELEPEFFYRAPHREIFAALRELLRRGDSIDLITLCAELRDRGHLESAGGNSGVASILEWAGTSSNAEGHIRLIRQAHIRRQAIAKAEAMVAELYNPLVPLELALNGTLGELAEARDSALSPEERHVPLYELVRNDQELMTAELQPIESVIGNRLIVAGGLTILVGLSGEGKTYLALQMMRSLAFGTHWLGHECQERRSGLLEFEMPDASIRDRIRDGISTPDLGGRCDFIIMPKEPGHLANPRTADEICFWCDRSKLSLLILDPLHYLHHTPVNFEEEAGALLMAARRIASRTGVSIVMLHHTNKLQFEKGTSLATTVKNSMRGSSRLQNDPDTIFGLGDYHGKRLLVYAKTRFCASPEFVPLRRDISGFFEVGPTEDQVQEQRRSETVEKIVIALDEAGSAGLTLTGIADRTGLNRRTVLRNLDAIEVIALEDPGRAHSKRYFLATSAPAEQQGF